MRLLPFVVALLCVIAAAGAAKETNKHPAAKKKQVDVKSAAHEKHAKKTVDNKKPLKKTVDDKKPLKKVDTPDEAVVPPSKKPKVVVTRASDVKVKNKSVKDDIVKIDVKPATPVKKQAVKVNKKNEAANEKLVDLKLHEKVVKQSVDAKKPHKKVDKEATKKDAVPLTKAPKVVVTRDSVTKTNIKPTKDVLAAGVVSKPTRIKKCLVVLNEATGELVNMTKPVKTGCLMKDARRTLIKMAKPRKLKLNTFPPAHNVSHANELLQRIDDRDQLPTADKMFTEPPTSHDGHLTRNEQSADGPPVPHDSGMHVARYPHDEL